MLNTFILLAGLCPALPSAALAQETTVRADLSASSVRYDESMRTTAVGLTPELIASWPRAMFRVAGSYSQLSGEGTALHGSGGFSLYTPSAGPLMAEFETFGAGSHTGSTNTNQLLGIARAHVGGAVAGGWIGGGFGTASDGTQRHPSRQGEVGGWVGRAPLGASVSVVPTVIDDTVRYTDVNIAAGAATRFFELTAFAGARSGAQPAVFGTPVRSWASATLTYPITRQLAIVAGAGRYPVDLTQALLGGSYASVGVRVGNRVSHAGSFAGTSRPPTQRPPPRAAEAPLDQLQVTTLPDGARLFAVRASKAQSVELMGDFNGWRPLALLGRPSGWWAIEVELPRGRYEVAMRVDGGEWTAPPGLLPLRDEFGGEVGLLDLP
jgi:hypothetical protein